MKRPIGIVEGFSVTGRSAKPRKDATERRAENEARRKKAIDQGLPWYVDHGGGRGKKAEPHTIFTIDDGFNFVAEVDDPAMGNRIVELIGALMQAKNALEPHTAIDGREFKAYQRAIRALNAVFKTVKGRVLP